MPQSSPAILSSKPSATSSRLTGFDVFPHAHPPSLNLDGADAPRTTPSAHRISPSSRAGSGSLPIAFPNQRRRKRRGRPAQAMTELTWGIAGGLGTGLAWAAISLLVQSLSGVLRPVSITAIRSTVGGVIIVVVALAAGHASETLRMPLWAVLALGTSILLSMGFGDTVFFASMDHLGVTRALILSLANPLFTTIVGIGL